MAFMRKNILVTGQPKSGKSTLLFNVVENIQNKIGFLTKEIRKEGIRTGFELVSCNGEVEVIADITEVTQNKVGKFYVQIENVDPFFGKIPSYEKDDLLYIDEIGQMQLLSKKFKEVVLGFLDSQNTCISTITSVYDDEFVKTVKEREDVILIEITPENRDEKLQFIQELLKKIEKAKNYSKEPERLTFDDSSHATLRSEHGFRKLVCAESGWQCECSFFDSHEICSHVITVDSVESNSKF
jgi:nucleoside-triphosphatase